MKYQINYKDENGATTAIDTVVAGAGYTADDYIRGCEENADEEWCEMLRRGTVTVEAEPLYIVTDGDEADGVYGDQYPVCIPEEEVRRLSKEFGTDLFEVMHEASEEEIERYGVYEG